MRPSTDEAAVPQKPLITRRIFVNLPIPNNLRDSKGRPAHRYVTNKIKTTKYTPFNFLFKNLFEQFRRVANCFFLLLAILQCFNEFKTIDPLVSAMPLIIIIALTAVKDGVEDWKRHSTDNTVNHRMTYTLGNWTNGNVHEKVKANALKRLTKGISLAFWGFLGWISEFFHKLIAISNTTSETDGERAEARVGSPVIERRASSNNNNINNARIFPASPAHIVSPAFPTVGAGGGSNGSPAASPNVKARPTSAGTARSRVDPNILSGARTTTDPYWRETNWKDVRVGDFIFLRNNEFIPADILILSTSEPEGLCYVQTKNLDGETNLKIRRGLAETETLKTAADCSKVQLQIDSEPPTTNLFTYNGTAVFENLEGSAPVKVPINLNSILLRGCVLRNTEYVIGLVLFTGADTKLQLNSGETPSKRTVIDMRMNPQVMFNLVLMLAMCIITAVGSKVWTQFYLSADAPFVITTIDFANNPDYNAFLEFWASLIAFQNLVPVSLILTVEIVKTIQALFIYQDAEMYHEETDTPCTARNWTLADDLGQIEYIFSDKTGTLTRNVMEFRRCSIGGVKYGDAPPQSGIQADQIFSETTGTVGVAHLPPLSLLTTPPKTTPYLQSDQHALPNIPHSVSPPKTPPPPHGHLPPLSSIKSPRSPLSPVSILKKAPPAIQITAPTISRPYASEEPTFEDGSLFRELENDSEQAELIVQFFTLLAVCHTVLARRPDPSDNYNVEYKAQSPDEAALVQTAKDCGFTFLDREVSQITIDVQGEQETFTLLNVLEFNSTRKRMSIIVKNPAGTLLLMCKGADNVIFERLAPGCQQLTDVTCKHLEEFADEGLRTLCLAYRVLTPAEYETWNAEYHEASTSLDEREAKLDRCAEIIEKQLTLLGATAIEDRLQAGVPEAIATLSRAGIKIWVLTGDKLETAISIGFSCNLLTKEMYLIVIKGGGQNVDRGAIYKQMKDALEQFWSPEGLPIGNQNYALIIDGPSLKFALEDQYKVTLLELACRCKAVVCCRVSPLQKAQVVELVKEGKGVMTCAIGDGANDVSMIQAAHVGVGISGEEGLQAVMASDYAIAQFRYLCRLLLVHGRYSYVKTGSTIYNFFYKNLIWTVVLFLYQLFCGFSNQVVYDFSLMLFYNLIFTCTPVMTLGIFDRDLDQSLLLALPQLYLIGVRQEIFTTRNFLEYILDGVYQGVICFFIPLGVYRSAPVSGTHGRAPDLSEMGTCMAVCSIVSATLFVGFNTHSWTWPHQLSIWMSALLVYIYVAIYSVSSINSTLSNLHEILFGSLTFWLTNLVTVVVALLPRYVLRYCFRTYQPTDANIMEEIKSLRLASKLKKAMTTSAVCLPQESLVTARDVPLNRAKTVTRRRSEKAVIGPENPVVVSPVDGDGGTSGGMLSPPVGLTNMRTGRVTRHRGFSFAQEEGMRQVLTGQCDVKRSHTLYSRDKGNYEGTIHRRKTLPTKLSLSVEALTDRSREKEGPPSSAI